MMNFIPPMYEDELLYSVLARYRRMCGMLVKAELLRDLYGGNKVLRSIFMPSHLTELVSNFPPYTTVTVDDIIRRHTMFPFYTALLPNELSDQIYSIMVHGEQRSYIYIAGYSGGRVKPSNYLKYCPFCFREDIQTKGESYWRRLFQVPGVLYCPQHKVLLKESTALSADQNLDFLCADEAVCSDQVHELEHEENELQLNLQYSQNVITLMTENYPKRELTDQFQFYIDSLRDRGYTSVSGAQVYVSKLVDNFISYYSPRYLTRMQSNGNWLRLFVRNYGRNKSPLRHLLLLQFLNIPIQDVFFAKDTIGKIAVQNQYTPQFSLEERKREWLKIIEENPGLYRMELKQKAPGLHNWLFRYDREWYEEVTPRLPRKNVRTVVDWESKDDTLLKVAQQAVDNLLNRKGKPIRITFSIIRREVGIKYWSRHPKLVKTNQYIQDVTEDINSYRIRKIKWAIEEMTEKGLTLSLYKVQVYAGYGGKNEEFIEARKIIDRYLKLGLY